MSRRRRSDEGIRELEIAAHALLATVHGLAALWHLRRRNWRIGTIHAAAAAFDAAALITHLTPPAKRAPSARVAASLRNSPS